MQQRTGLLLTIDRLTKISPLRTEFKRVSYEALGTQRRRILTFTCTKKGMRIIRDVWRAVDKRETRCTSSIVDYRNSDNTYTIRLEWGYSYNSAVEVRSNLLAELLNEACLRAENATELFRTL